MIHLLLEARKGNLKHETNKADESTGFATVEESDVGKTHRSLSIELTDETIVAQALIFFFAGFETSTALSFMALELAINADVQHKLIDEIDMVYKEYTDDVPYDVILKMQYLDQVVSGKY